MTVTLAIIVTALLVITYYAWPLLARRVQQTDWRQTVRLEPVETKTAGTETHDEVVTNLQTTTKTYSHTRRSYLSWWLVVGALLTNLIVTQLLDEPFDWGFELLDRLNRLWLWLVGTENISGLYLILITVPIFWAIYAFLPKDIKSAPEWVRFARVVLPVAFLLFFVHHNEPGAWLRTTTDKLETCIGKGTCVADVFGTEHSTLYWLALLLTKVAIVALFKPAKLDSFSNWVHFVTVVVGAFAFIFAIHTSGVGMRLARHLKGVDECLKSETCIRYSNDRIDSWNPRNPRWVRIPDCRHDWQEIRLSAFGPAVEWQWAVRAQYLSHGVWRTVAPHSFIARAEAIRFCDTGSLIGKQMPLWWKARNE